MAKDLDNPTEIKTEEGIEDTIENEMKNTPEEEVQSSSENEIQNTLENEEEITLEEEREEETTIEDQQESLLEDEVGITLESQVNEVIDSPIKRHKRIFIGILLSFYTLLGFYFGMTIYFIDHFYFGSEINGMDVSGKYSKYVENIMTSGLQEYSLNIKERGGKSEQIKGSEIGLRYISEEEFKKLKNSQNPFAWFLPIFNKDGYKMTIEVIYDEESLDKSIDELSCFDRHNIIEPQNPSFQYIGNSYTIVDEIEGAKVDKDILYSQVVDAIQNEKSEIDLESINGYISPRYSSKSQEVLETKDILNKYTSSRITYDFGNSKEVIDGTIISQWLTVDANYNVEVDEKKIEEYIEVLSDQYCKAGKTRDFVTTSGRTIQVSGGDFSRPINKSYEIDYLISAIKEGEVSTKQPTYDPYISSYNNSDIGNTYVEIDLTKQHLWFYKNGSLIVQGDVVTGDVRRRRITPKGVYVLKYKQRNAILRGPGYAAPVNYWMPFNGGIGIHDANWRGGFGGNIYITNGSHGCVNCPNYLAKTIFYNIEPGTPVICY